MSRSLRALSCLAPCKLEGAPRQWTVVVGRRSSLCVTYPFDFEVVRRERASGGATMHGVLEALRADVQIEKLVISDACCRCRQLFVLNGDNANNLLT